MLPSEINSRQVTGRLEPINIEAIEGYMLSMPAEVKAEIPVHHHFGPGVYIRQITIPKGSMAIGHEQRFAHTNILLTGAVAMYEETGVKVLTAPLIFTGQPGRKLGMAIDDCVWLNIFATDETDIDKLEEMIAKKSDTFKAHQKSLEVQYQELESKT
jgi:hypothetical protein